MFSKSTEYDENCTQFAKQHTKLHNLLKSAAYQENLTRIAFFPLFTFHIHNKPSSIIPLFTRLQEYSNTKFR